MDITNIDQLIGGTLMLDYERYAKLGKELCEISKDLKTANFPLHAGLLNENFDQELRSQASYLHKQLKYLLQEGNATPQTRGGCPARQAQIKKVKWNDAKMVATCDLLVSGGVPFDIYHQQLKKFDCLERCNSVWPTDFIAYRCTTCAYNPCMSLCSDCFLNANHEGHDFNRFFSLAGGACDCGNEDVLNPKGFCTKHGPNREKQGPVPVELTATLEFLLVKLFVRLLNTCRAWEHRRSQFMSAHHNIPYTGQTQMEYISKIIYDEAEGIVLFIQHFVDLGGPIIDVVAQILLDEQLYTSLKTQEDNPDAFLEDLCASSNYFDQDLQTLSPLQFPFSLLQVAKSAGIDVNSEDDAIEYGCLLDECFFYLIRLNFPQTLINLLLCILSNSKYKTKFSCRFFENYPLILDLMHNLVQQLPQGSNEPAELTNRIIHISVQICSSANICRMLQETILVTEKILDNTIKVFYWDTKILQLSHSKETFFNRTYVPPSNLEQETDDSTLQPMEYLTVDVEKNKFITKFGYSYLITDVQNIFSHASLAFELMHNRHLCEKYVMFIAPMQGMNVMWRIVEGSHQEYENTGIIQRAFTLEWDASAQIMFNTLSTESPNGSQAMSNALKTFSKFIKIYLHSVKVEKGDPFQCQPYATTFHLPLHRHLAYALMQALSVGDHFAEIATKTILSDEIFLRQVILHPIRIQVVRAEYLAGMWIRNGGMIRNSVIYFDRPSLTFGCQTLDLFLCRISAANMNQEFFWNIVVKSFHLEDCFSFDEDFRESMSNGRIITSKSWISFVFDGCLRFLLDILVPQVGKNVTLESELRAELVCALSFGSSPHSKLRQSIPARGIRIDEKYSLIFDKVLNEISDFSQPDSGEMYQGGLYTLKESVWAQEFDPVLCRMRCNNAREFHSLVIKAEERDLARLKQSNSEDRKWNAQHLWLGYRLVNFDANGCFEAIQPAWALLTQPTFFYIMQFILNRWLISEQEQNLILQEAVYLLTLSVKFVSSNCFEQAHIVDKLYHCPTDQSFGAFDNFTTDYHGLEIKDSNDRRHSILSFFTYATANESSILDLLLAHFSKAEEAIDPKMTKAKIYSKLMKSFINKDPKSLDRIFGSASEYLGRLLCLLYHSDSVSKKFIDHLYETQVFKNAENQLESIKIDQGISEEPSTTAFKEKKLLAKRKQTALIQSQKLKQAKVMQKMMKIEGLSLTEIEDMDAKQVKTDEVFVYECPICNDSSTNTLNDLMGLMVHVQSNGVMDSVLGGHEKQLSLTDIGMMRKKYGDVPFSRRTRRNWNQAKDAMLSEVYSDLARFVRLPSGISACTCGHTAHLACFQAYTDTVVASNSAQQMPFTDKIYSCPMCRQSVNAILPLKPELSSEKLRLSLNYADESVLPEAAARIKECILLKHGLEQNPPDLDNYQNAFVSFEKVCRQINKFRRIDADLSFSQEQMFTLLRAKGQSLVLGIVKNNIEHQQLLSRKKISNKKPSRKFNLIKHLLFGSRLSSTEETGRSTDQQETSDEFGKLLGNQFATDISHGQSKANMPPLLLFDCKSLLLRVCTYILGVNNLLDSDKFELCKIVYRHVLCMALCQIALHVLVRISKESVEELLSGGLLLEMKDKNDLAEACDFVCKSMQPCLSCFFNHLQPSVNVQGPASEAIDLLLSLSESTCSELTRFFINLVDEHNLCNLLDHLVLSQPSSSTTQADFGGLELMQLPDFYSKSHIDLHEMVFGSRNVLASITFTKPSLVEWVRELDHAMFEQTANIIIAEDIVEWREPGLLTLPYSFDDLFSLFFGAICRTCNTSPPSPMICLICGEVICLDKCCSVSMPGGYTSNEIEKHSVECGSGCACFLSLHSTLVVITRNSQALIWGSVFLDSYGEEDRNLRRGKPLYLSKHRMDCLQKGWLEHNFIGKSNNGLRTWFPMEHVRQFLKDSHYYSY